MTAPAVQAPAPLPTAADGLRALSSCGGCAAKAQPSLVEALTAVVLAQHAATPVDPALLVGLQPSDDAAVYRLDDDRALVATVDFFPAVVDDPADFGTVAAANAVSDVYAMGGEVQLALVVSGFPPSVADEVVQAVTRAAADVVVSCGGTVAGGHSIRCAEPVFGLAVLGLVHPDRVWRKSGARPGDVLVLSKPLGTGVLLSGGGARGAATATASMSVVNRAAAQALRSCDAEPHAVTDVTGYGLVGHAWEMAERSDVRVRLHAEAIPLLPGAREEALAGVRTSADRSNRSSVAGRLTVDDDVPPELLALLHDPQTSGGLLAAVPPSHLPFLREQGFQAVGSVHAGPMSIEVVRHASAQ